MWLEEMSVRDLFEPNEEDDGGDDPASKLDESLSVNGELSISKKELRRRLLKTNNGRLKETKTKRQKRKLLEKLKVS